MEGTGELPATPSRRADALSLVRGIRERLRAEPVDVRRTWQVLAGAVLVAAGPIVMLLGYAGAARTPYIEEQIPYVISGGLVGLGMMTLGGFFFWGHWLYRQYERQEYHQARLLEAIQELPARLQAQLLAASGTTADPAPTAALVMTGRGTVVHDPACAVVSSSKTKTKNVTAAAARARGYRPCGICNPALGTG